MRFIFSYVLFGDNEKYLWPLIENISTLEKRYGFQIVIVIYCIGIPHYWYEKLNKYQSVELRCRNDLIEVPATLKMLQRYMILNDETDNQTCFVFRDSDSLVSKRELEIIEHWSHTEFDFSVIRDHPHHIMPIMGGLLSCKGKGVKLFAKILRRTEENISNFNEYGFDQVFLDKYLYAQQKENFLIYSSCGVFLGETVIDISKTAETIGGYVGEQGSRRRKFTLPPAVLFRALRYRGANFRLNGWHGVKVIDYI
jgi:hypothetical protein